MDVDRLQTLLVDVQMGKVTVAAVTAELLGHRVERIYDVGVAGLHRLLAQRELLASAFAHLVLQQRTSTTGSFTCA